MMQHSQSVPSVPTGQGQHSKTVTRPWTGHGGQLPTAVDYRGAKIGPWNNINTHHKLRLKMQIKIETQSGARVACQGCQSGCDQQLSDDTSPVFCCPEDLSVALSRMRTTLSNWIIKKTNYIPIFQTTVWQWNQLVYSGYSYHAKYFLI